jgi:D-3-phosphoglycerate dehydrogenase
MHPLVFSKQKGRVLLLEGVNEAAVALFRGAGYEDIVRIPGAMDEACVATLIEGVHILGIRSRTRVTEPLLERADRLTAIGCFSVGTDQVDLDAARRHGIPVFNAPFSNTRSVAELVVGEIIALLRRLVPLSASAHAGRWDKSPKNSHEIRGKTLGIVGYGNIGSQLSTLAEVLGLRVLFYDHVAKLRHGNAQAVGSLAELLAASDIVTLHVPDTPATRGMIGEGELRAMKPGAYLINNSRGAVVDLKALASVLREGHLRGAAIDVFPVEPASGCEPFRSPLQGIPNVILTPHIGGSTEEAQERIGIEVAQKLIEHSETGSTVGAVNFPQAQLSLRPRATRYIHVHQNAPGALRRITDIFSRRHLNIEAQCLQTDGEIGYVVVEADSSADDSASVLDELRSLEGTIRARLLHGARKDAADFRGAKRSGCYGENTAVRPRIPA